MPLSEHDKTGVPPKKPTGNEIKKDLDFTGKLYRLINKVHIVDIRDSTKPDAEYANAFKISCEKENISNVVTVFNEHYINMVFTDKAKYLVDCKFKIIALSETDLNESYKNLRKRKNSVADVPENDTKEGIASELESADVIEGYDPTYGCGYASSESSSNNAGDVHVKIINNSGEKEFCYKCGKLLKNGTIFCSYCGTKQSEGESQPSNPNEPPKEDSNENWRGLFLKNNLDEYIELFEKNKLDDIEIISKLNETDLEKLGITIMGDRKKILKVISDEIGNKREKVRKLYQQGWSINEIAKALKLEENLVSFYCGGKKNEGGTSSLAAKESEQPWALLKTGLLILLFFLGFTLTSRSESDSVGIVIFRIISIIIIGLLLIRFGILLFKRLSGSGSSSTAKQENIESSPNKPKERNGFVTFWLVFAACFSIYSLIDMFSKSTNSFFNVLKLFNLMSDFQYIFFIISGIANIISYVLLLNWKKIGFWLMIGTAVLNAFVLSNNGGVIFVWLVFSALSILVLFGILNIRKNGVTTWEQLT